MHRCKVDGGLGQIGDLFRAPGGNWGAGQGTGIGMGAGELGMDPRFFFWARGLKRDQWLTFLAAGPRWMAGVRR